MSPRDRDLILLTWRAEPDADREPAEAVYGKLAGALRDAQAFPIQERVFGSAEALSDLLSGRALAARTDPDVWVVPPTCVEGRPAGGGALAGIHILAARGASTRVISAGGQALGRLVEGPSSRLLGLADVGRCADEPDGATPVQETASVIESSRVLLEHERFSYRDVARTWFYLRDILDWYDGFNEVRNAAFRRMGLIGPDGDGGIPASTGIAGRGARGGWCTLDLIACQPRAGAGFAMERLRSRKQNEATEYGSAFARGMALSLGAHRYVFVSGTAAIDDGGASVHPGDFERQLRHTLDAVAAVVAGAGGALGQIEQATSFLKRPEDLASYEASLAAAGLADLPALITVADVCRDDLMFEIDAIAVVPVGE